MNNNSLLDNNSINLNISGFNDDSMFSETDEIHENSNFLIKSISSRSIERDSKGNNIFKTNSLQSDFEIIHSDDIFSNRKKSTNYTDVIYEDLFLNKYEIPMNRPSKFSISRMAHQFTYESNSKISSYKIESKKFGLSKTSEVITYLLSLFTFSEFFNLEEIQKDKRFKLFFIKKNKNQKKFIIDDATTNNILNNLEMPSNESHDFQMFIEGINQFLNQKGYINIQEKNKKKLISVYLMIALISLLILGDFGEMYFTVNIYDNEMSKILLVLEGILLFIFMCSLIIRIIDAKNLQLLFLYYDLRYFLVNYEPIYEYIEEWNRNLFENYKINISVPISLNYIMFNLNPYQNIEIKHLNMNSMKKQFYKSQKELFKSENEFRLFNLIQQNLLQNRNRGTISTSIN